MKRAIALVLLACIAAGAAAQGYPARVVRIIVPYPAGTGPDNVGRLVAQQFQEALGQFIKAEIAKWARDAREAGMQPE